MKPGPVVAARALCLLTVQLRCMAEQAGDGDPKNAGAHWRHFRSWFDELAIRDHLLPIEATVIDTDIGECDPELVMAATWTIESLGVLLWALGRISALPPSHAKFELDDILAASPSSAEATTTFITDAKLRPKKELDHEERQASQSLARLLSLPPPTSEDLQMVAALVELRAHALRWLTSDAAWNDVDMDV